MRCWPVMGLYPACTPKYPKREVPPVSLSDYRLIGTGEPTSPACNTVTAVKYCSDCGEVAARYHHCHNWDCPECYFWNSSDSAYDVAERLYGVRRAYAAVGKHLGRFQQVIFSVPPDQWDGFDLKVKRGEVYAHALLIGVLGGAVWFHSHRIKPELKGPLIEAMKGTDLIGGLWAGAHADLLGLGSVEAYGVPGPHFHVLGYYPRTRMNSDVFYEATGWTYKAKLSPDRDPFTTARYLFSHAAIRDRVQAVTYFGVAAYNKTSVERIKTTTVEACPKCGSGNYWLIKCGAHRFEQLSAGVQLINGKFQRIKPADSELVLHVRTVKTVKFFCVRTKQTGLTVFGATA